MTESIVVAPEVGFRDLRRRLESLGWLLGRESQEVPLVAGEPHWCEFWRRGRDETIRYAFNPVVKLRVLDFEGPGAAALRAAAARVVPSLDADAIARCLRSDDERTVLLGILAAGRLRELSAVARLRELEADPRPRVAAAARQVREELLPAPVADALDLLVAAKRAHPERSALFSMYGGPEQRRQILRWLVHDFTAANASIDEVLRAALVDADPEVRITAVLAAARLDARRLAREVERAELPESTGDGADPRERRLYARLRDGVVTWLTRGETPPDRATWPPLHRALTAPVDVTDDMMLLLHALTTPIEPVERAQAPEGMAYVAAVPHWLGHRGELRQVTPARAFFVSVKPVGEGTWDEVARSGARLPTADQWEMAMRGPDGRLFPWGNNLAGTARGGRSPWGVAPPTTLEWTADAGVVVGGDRLEPASIRRAATPGLRAAYRVIVEA